MPATRAAKSLGLSCPMCGSQDGVIALNLNDTKEVTCEGCGESYAPAEAVRLASANLARWQAVKAWIDAAPTE